MSRNTHPMAYNYHVLQCEPTILKYIVSRHALDVQLTVCVDIKDEKFDMASWDEYLETIKSGRRPPERLDK